MLRNDVVETNCDMSCHSCKRTRIILLSRRHDGKRRKYDIRIAGGLPVVVGSSRFFCYELRGRQAPPRSDRAALYRYRCNRFQRHGVGGESSRPRLRPDVRLNSLVFDRKVAAGLLLTSASCLARVSRLYFFFITVLKSAK